MEQSLVYNDNGKVVTDSVTLATAFGKRHDKVLRDIRGLKCSQQFKASNFGESEYENKQGRMMPMFILTFEGFTMVAMGYSGEKAMEYKEKFISEFKGTATNLESQKNLDETGNVSGLLESYEDMITLRSVEQKNLQMMVKWTIHKLYFTVRDSARRKYFAQLYKDLKREFNVESYKDIRLVDYEKAKAYVQMWGLPKNGES